MTRFVLLFFACAGRGQNTDAGTMSPFEHGEVFVLDDGGEADLDLGNYERFLGVRLSRDHNITTGKVSLSRALANAHEVSLHGV